MLKLLDKRVTKPCTDTAEHLTRTQCVKLQKGDVYANGKYDCEEIEKYNHHRIRLCVCNCIYDV